MSNDNITKKVSQKSLSDIGRLHRTFTFLKNQNFNFSPNSVNSNFGHLTFQIFHQNKNGDITFTHFSPNLLSEINTEFSPLLLVKTSGPNYTCDFRTTCTFSRPPFPIQHCIKECECKMYSPRKFILMPVRMFDIFPAYSMQCFNHNYYSPQMMMMMLPEQSCQTFVTCKSDQVVTGERTPPLHFSHQRRQRCFNTDNIGDNHLFHTDSVKCPNFGNHHYLDVPKGYDSIATVGEIRVYWRADFQSGSRVLKKVF